MDNVHWTCVPIIGQPWQVLMKDWRVHLLLLLLLPEPDLDLLLERDLGMYWSIRWRNEKNRPTCSSSPILNLSSCSYSYSCPLSCSCFSLWTDFYFHLGHLLLHLSFRAAPAREQLGKLLCTQNTIDNYLQGDRWFWWLHHHAHRACQLLGRRGVLNQESFPI